MLAELNGKGGRLCQLAQDGKLHCPLIVRPTSEDVVTGELFNALRILNPRWWLPDLLNRALGTPRFRRQVFRRFRIDVWQKQPVYPGHLVPWKEGATEVDVVLSWENPQTTVFIEMKYWSGLSPTTTNNDGDCGFPSDQLIRNARVGLWRCGWVEEEQLFESEPRDFVLLLMTPGEGSPLVQTYRNESNLRAAIPHNNRIKTLPKSPFIGEISFKTVSNILQEQKRWFTRSERAVVDGLTEYLDFKCRR